MVAGEVERLQPLEQARPEAIGVDIVLNLWVTGAEIEPVQPHCLAAGALVTHRHHQTTKVFSTRSVVHARPPSSVTEGRRAACSLSRIVECRSRGC